MPNLKGLLDSPTRLKTVPPVVVAVVRTVRAAMASKRCVHTRSPVSWLLGLGLSHRRCTLTPHPLLGCVRIDSCSEDELRPAARDFIANASGRSDFAVLLRLTVLMVAAAQNCTESNRMSRFESRLLEAALKQRLTRNGSPLHFTVAAVCVSWARWILEGAVPMLGGQEGHGIDLALSAGLVVGEWQMARARPARLQLLPPLGEPWAAQIAAPARLAREAWLAPASQPKSVRLPGE